MCEHAAHATGASLLAHKQSSPPGSQFPEHSALPEGRGISQGSCPWEVLSEEGIPFVLLHLFFPNRFSEVPAGQHEPTAPTTKII